MFIRYQWVRNVVLLGGTGSIIAVCAGSEGEAPQAPAGLVQKGAAVEKGSVEVDDAVIIAAADKPVDGGKVKDAFRGRTKVKVNIYDDNGDRVADRLKVDRDRDDTWDESWTRKGGQWERGDGTVWQGGAWRRPDAAGVGTVGGAAAAATAATSEVEKQPAADPTESLRLEVARLILEGRASGDKLKDYTRGRGPKFNLYDDDKDGRWDRAKADYDRDDTWDENWTRKGDTVERKDLKSGAIQLLEGGAWKVKGP